MGMQRDGAIGVGARSPIFQIALDGATEVGELATDLMVTARMEVDFQQIVAPRRACDGAVVEDGGLSVGRARGDDERLVEFFVAGERIFQMAVKRRRLVVGDGPIGFLKLVVFDHVVHAAKRLGGLCEKHHTRYGAIQTVDDATEDVARFGIAEFEEVLDFVGEAGVTRFVALDNLSG